ncbi:MAG: hypothetical protein WCO93_04055 [bacterium]
MNNKSYRHGSVETRNPNGIFLNLTSFAIFWSSTEYSSPFEGNLNLSTQARTSTVSTPSTKQTVFRSAV